jgi:hypothetical protein
MPWASSAWQEFTAPRFKRTHDPAGRGGVTKAHEAPDLVRATPLLVVVAGGVVDKIPPAFMSGYPWTLTDQVKEDQGGGAYSASILSMIRSRRPTSRDSTSFVRVWPAMKVPSSARMIP